MSNITVKKLPGFGEHIPMFMLTELPTRIKRARSTKINKNKRVENHHGKVSRYSS